jgi:hypothetical protein
MRWLTRERILIDRVACPWLIRRFIDPEAEFLFAPEHELAALAARRGATLYDVKAENVELTHAGEYCSFDAFLKKYALKSDALARMALIVRGADTARLDLAPQCAGLLAISQGLRRIAGSDAQMIALATPVYEALHAWAEHEDWKEVHSWTYTYPRGLTA